jgi:4-oxalocrotonate tautomerase
MPLVRIEMMKGKPREYRAKLSRIVYETMLETLNMPADDRFQVITEHDADGLIFDRDYLGIHRTDDCIVFQITLNAGRSIETKQKFYKTLADRLHEELQLRREDVLINLVDVPKENWSFGNGEAQYVKP